MREVRKPSEVEGLLKRGVPIYYKHSDLDKPVPAGVITEITSTGKTVITSGGCVFKYRNAHGRFALKGAFATHMLAQPKKKAVKKVAKGAQEAPAAQ